MTDYAHLLRELEADGIYASKEDGEALLLAANIIDVIPGDDKKLVAKWAVKITRAAIERHDAAYAVDLDERALAHGVANCHATIDDCPPSVRAALRGGA